MLVEPAARNTAPCVGLAAIEILETDPDGIMFVMPADHVIQPVEAFARGARRAIRIVEKDPGCLALFGVIPAFPATGYGYIERGTQIADGSPRVYSVSARFAKSRTRVWRSSIFAKDASSGTAGSSAGKLRRSLICSNATSRSCIPV
ncbi:MAG: sugar phosphate nucleotidyltransferase [Planctomycetaceae bacterium]